MDEKIILRKGEVMEWLAGPDGELTDSRSDELAEMYADLLADGTGVGVEWGEAEQIPSDLAVVYDGFAGYLAGMDWVDDD